MHGRKLAAFDTETSSLILSRDVRWDESRPTGITCLAIHPQGRGPLTRYGSFQGKPAARMNARELRLVLTQLEALVAEGFCIITWGGLGMDFRLLSQEAASRRRCRQLARHHVDMMFQVHCERGHPVALDKAAEGMGIRGKLDGLSGKQMPGLWSRGEYERVLEYVADDVRLILQVAQQAEANHKLTWITRAGQPFEMPLHKGWLTVDECLNLPLPDTSWMPKAIPRDAFSDWLN